MQYFVLNLFHKKFIIILLSIEPLELKDTPRQG